jgi:hypothetical protein
MGLITFEIGLYNDFEIKQYENEKKPKKAQK